MREIFLNITNEYIKQSDRFAGVQGAANATALILSFDESWDGFAKHLTWFNAEGQNPVYLLLTVDKALDQSFRKYRVLIPKEALELGGNCMLVIEGYKDSAVAKSITAEFEVAPSPDTSEALPGQEPSPTLAQQLQEEIEDIKNGIVAAVSNSAEAQKTAKTAEENSKKLPYPADEVWHIWNGTEYVATNEPSRGEKGDKGDKGDTGADGVNGKDGAPGKDGVVDYNLVANALKGNASGEVISLDDVSSLPHNLGVKVQSKNLYDINNFTSVGSRTYAWYAIGDFPWRLTLLDRDTSVDISGINLGIALYSEGPITAYSWFVSDGTVNCRTKDNYADNDGNSKNIRCDSLFVYPNTQDNIDMLNQRFAIMVTAGDETTTEYTPYVDVEHTKVLATGKNLVDIDSMVNELLTDNGDGTYTFTAVTGGQGVSNTAPLEIKQGANITLSCTLVESGGGYNSDGIALMFYYADGTSEQLTAWKSVGYTKKWTTTKDIVGASFHHYGGSYGQWFTIKDIQIEYGTEKTAYEKFKGTTEYPVNADGTAQGVQSIAPNMTITSNASGVVLDVGYNKDTNKVIEKLINRIAALESAVI